MNRIQEQKLRSYIRNEAKKILKEEIPYDKKEFKEQYEILWGMLKRPNDALSQWKILDKFRSLNDIYESNITIQDFKKLIIDVKKCVEFIAKIQTKWQ